MITSSKEVSERSRNHGLWGICAYFNPAGYKNKYKNYAIFRKELKKQGLPLIAVECAVDDGLFELNDDDAEKVIRIESGDILWQKERLLNIALRHLPPECRKVVWLDADIIFLNKNWVKDTSLLLDEYVFVQPFKEVGFLPPQAGDFPGVVTSFSPVRFNVSTIYAWLSSDGKKPEFTGSTGFAGAARRELLDKFGFYDRMILGGGDAVMLSAFVGMPLNRNPYLYYYPGKLLKHAQGWCSKAAEFVQGRVFYTEGTLLHLWHGFRVHRYYVGRRLILKDLNPESDIKFSKNGAWEWSSDKEELHKNVGLYFKVRREKDEPLNKEESALEKKLLAAQSKWLVFCLKLRRFFNL